jgi:chromosome segregation ATPase
VTGSNAKEKLLTVTRGKRDELATFQDFIDYSADLVSALLQRLVPYDEDDSDEEVKRLKAIIADLDKLIRKLELEIQRLKAEVDALLPNDPLIQQKKEQIDNLLQEKEGIRERMKDYNEKMSQKYDNLSKKNAELEKDVALTKDQFEDFKKKFIAESDRVRTQLTNAHKEGQLQLKKAQEDGFMKDKILEASEREVNNLDALVKNIEQNNRNLLNANKNLQGAFDDLRANAKKEINTIKDLIQDTVDQSNQLNNLIKDKHHENSQLDNKLDNLVKSSKEYDIK